MATVENERAIKVLNELREKGFNFSLKKIAEYLNQKKITRSGGLPYERNDINNSLNSDFITDKNIVKAIDDVKRSVDKGLKRVQKFHQTVGPPIKKK